MVVSNRAVPPALQDEQCLRDTASLKVFLCPFPSKVVSQGALCRCKRNPESVAAGVPGGPTLADSQGWQELMKLVQRCSVVVTEDMPVDPEAHDLQVFLQAWQ